MDKDGINSRKHKLEKHWLDGARQEHPGQKIDHKLEMSQRTQHLRMLNEGIVSKTILPLSLKIQGGRDCREDHRDSKKFRKHVTRSE